MSKIRRLEIPKHFIDLIVKTALKTEIEICGLLLGKIINQTAIVKELSFGRNIRKSPILFEIASEDIYRILTYAERKGLEVVGMFHSHPANPYPSQRDLRFMKLWPIPWLIVSSITGDFDCYAYDSEEKRIYKVKIKAISF